MEVEKHFRHMRLQVHHAQRRIGGNVILAILVQWNILFSLCIYAVVAFAYYGKRLVERQPGEIERAWYGSIVGGWAITEGARLSLGYRGNVHQSVSHLFGFVAMTFATYMSLLALYFRFVPNKGPMDYSISVVGLIFAVLESVFGIAAVSKLIRRNTVQFYVHLGATITEP